MGDFMIHVCVMMTDPNPPSESDNLANHDFIGACECSLGEVVATQGLGVTR